MTKSKGALLNAKNWEKLVYSATSEIDLSEKILRPTRVLLADDRAPMRRAVKMRANFHRPRY